MPEFSASLNPSIKRSKKKDAALLSRFTREITSDSQTYAFFSIYSDLCYEPSSACIGSGYSPHNDFEVFLNFENIANSCFEGLKKYSCPLFSAIVADASGDSFMTLAYVNEYDDLLHLSCPIKAPPLLKRGVTREGTHYMAIYFDELRNETLSIVYSNFGTGIYGGLVVGGLNLFAYIASSKTLDTVERGLKEFYEACYPDESYSIIAESPEAMYSNLLKAEKYLQARCSVARIWTPDCMNVDTSGAKRRLALA